ncbi:MAG: WD40 repeat domain-containing protein [Planctomycetaceae bacterium]|nr:WD40 repeat domain-containing protein [Planctomycetaceae bacterium]
MLWFFCCFIVVLLLTGIFVINNYKFADGNESADIDIEKLRIIRGHSSEITSWTYYLEEHGPEVADQHKPLRTGLIATTDSETVLIRDINSGVVIGEILPSDGGGAGMLEFSPDHKYLAIAPQQWNYSMSDTYSAESMTIVFWDIEKHKKLQYEIVLELCVAVLSMNYSVDGKFICLFIENKLPNHKRETSLQIYDISGKTPIKIKPTHKKIPFPIYNRHVKGATENQLEDSLKGAEFYEWNARFTTPSPDDNYKYHFLQNVKSPNWTEKKLFGATSIISPDGKKAVTLYPNGELHVWNTITGKTHAKYNFDRQYRRLIPGHFETIRDNFIHGFSFADDKFILLKTEESVLIYSVDQNRLVGVCTPPTNKPITKYLDLFGIEIGNAVLYKGKILKLEKGKSIFIYRIGKPNKLILEKQMERFMDISTKSSSTGRYILFENGGYEDRFYELWDNEKCKMMSLNIKSASYLLYGSFSQDDKFILFYKEPAFDG